MSRAVHTVAVVQRLTFAPGAVVTMATSRDRRGDHVSPVPVRSVTLADDGHIVVANLAPVARVERLHIQRRRPRGRQSLLAHHQVAMTRTPHELESGRTAPAHRVLSGTRL
jgi:hypothetical protein